MPSEVRKTKTAGIIQTGRHLARSIFHTDPHFCAARNEAAKATDYEAMAKAMAQSWSEGLPLGEAK